MRSMPSAHLVTTSIEELRRALVGTPGHATARGESFEMPKPECPLTRHCVRDVLTSSLVVEAFNRE
jgi:hypothetical protein